MELLITQQSHLTFIEQSINKMRMKTFIGDKTNFEILLTTSQREVILITC